MIITAELAQQIVDHIRPTVPHNINIMDENAVIIASGTPHRIGVFHGGAKLAIDTNAVVEIYPADLPHFPGTQPGLNWPMLMGNQVVGTVGVTGHPDEVRETAKLVKMVTELILEREFLREEFRSQVHLKEQFATLLLSEQSLIKQPEIKQTAGLLKYDLSLPRFVAVVDIFHLFAAARQEYGPHGLIESRAQENIFQFIHASSGFSDQDLIIFLDSRLVLLKVFSPLPSQSPPDFVRQWGAAFHQSLENHFKIPFAFGSGSLANAYPDLHASYCEALHALQLFPGSLIPASIYDPDILASYLLKKTAASTASAAATALTEKIHSLGNKYDIRKTILALLHNNLNVSTTAKELYIHRNTLLFRLEQFKQHTGLDPGNNLNHALLCKILFA